MEQTDEIQVSRLLYISSMFEWSELWGNGKRWGWKCVAEREREREREYECLWLRISDREREEEEEEEEMESNRLFGDVWMNWCALVEGGMENRLPVGVSTTVMY